MTTKIEWCDDTINFFTGCRTGCSWCYARRMAHRLGHIPGTVYQRVARATSGCDPETGILDGLGDPFAPAWHGDVAQRAYEKLTHCVPDGRGSRRFTRAPRRVFVGSMGDMCFSGAARLWDGVGLPQGIIGTKEVQFLTSRWATHVESAGHTVLLLTKRPDLLDTAPVWPSNVHLGVSVTCIDDAWRVDALHDWWGRMAAQHGVQPGSHAQGPGVLWASVEPLLDDRFSPRCLKGLDWVVVGFESNLARACSSRAAGVYREPTVRDVPRAVAVHLIESWCRDHGVPLFCKDSVSKVLGGTWPQEYPKAGNATR